jgi:hypothetical protein
LFHFFAFCFCYVTRGVNIATGGFYNNYSFCSQIARRTRIVASVKQTQCQLSISKPEHRAFVLSGEKAGKQADFGLIRVLFAPGTLLT